MAVFLPRPSWPLPLSPTTNKCPASVTTATWFLPTLALTISAGSAPGSGRISTKATSPGPASRRHSSAPSSPGIVVPQRYSAPSSLKADANQPTPGPHCTLSIFKPPSASTKPGFSAGVLSAPAIGLASVRNLGSPHVYTSPLSISRMKLPPFASSCFGLPGRIW